MVVRLLTLARGTVRLLAIPFGIGAAFALTPWFGTWTLYDASTFYSAGAAVLEGASPYPAPSAAFLETELAYVYPPALALVLAPLSVVPWATFALLFTLAAVACIPASLLLLGVRDPRCHAVALLYPATLNGIWVGTISPFLLLGLAAAWRWRDRVGRAAAIVGLLAVAKLFLAPLGVWLVATRRTGTAAIAAAVAFAAAVGSWAVIGFAGFRDYPDVLRLLGDVLAAESYSVTALGLAAGLSGGASTALAVGVAAVLAAAAVVVGRRGGDALSLSLALGAALAASPIVWPHYFTLLIVPLAIAAPRFSGAWLLPLALWPVIHGHSAGAPGQIALVLALAGIALFGPSCLARRRSAAGVRTWTPVPPLARRRVGHPGVRPAQPESASAAPSRAPLAEPAS